MSPRQARIVADGGALTDREEQDREQHEAGDHHEERREPVHIEHDAKRDRPAADRDRERLTARVDRVEQGRGDDGDDRERRE